MRNDLNERRLSGTASSAVALSGPTACVQITQMPKNGRAPLTGIEVQKNAVSTNALNGVNQISRKKWLIQESHAACSQSSFFDNFALHGCDEYHRN